MFAQLNSRHTRSIWLLVIVIGNWSGYAKAEPEQPPLLKKMAVLQCTTDLQTASKTVNTLFNISPPGFQWPDEWLGTRAAQPALHAQTLDITLLTLKNTAERFPSLRQTVERVALQWNYCDVFSDATFFNLSVQTHTLQKRLAASETLAQWSGFKQWGFFTPDPPDRFVPQLLSEMRLAPLGYQYFLHRVYRQHCFPHPETGQLVTEAEAAPPVLFSRVTPSPPADYGTPETFPYAWNAECPTPKSAAQPHTILPNVAVSPARIPPPVQPAVVIAQTVAPVVVEIPPEPMTTPIPAPPSVASAAKLLVILDTPRNTQTNASTKPHSSAAHSIPKPPQTPPSKRKRQTDSRKNTLPTLTALPTIVAHSPALNIPVFFDGEEQHLNPVDTSPHAKPANAASTRKSKRKKLRLAGNIADTYSIKDGSNTLSASATWSPKENWFATGNVSVKDGQLGYSWGAGYADWRPGKWSAQVNNYGPISPGKGLDLDNAIASVGYQFKSKSLEKRKLNASANLSLTGLSGQGKASASTTVQWNPKPNWYARTTASIPLEGGAPNWTYGFGYNDPRPNKWRVEYSNYGNNKYPGDNLKDGSITISRGWQF